MSYSAPFPENSRHQPEDLALYALRQKFKALFPHGWDFIVKETPEANWKTIKKYNLTEAKLWYKYTDTQQIIGVRFGKTTRHGLGDIDIGSKYDPREQEVYIDALKEELAKWGIVRLFFVQSSFSGGLHLYFFFEREVNTFRLACVLRKAAEDAGLEVKKGQLETFPNTKRYNSLFNGHRLPLQQGSCLLNDDCIPESHSLEDFIAAAQWSAVGNDTDLLESRLEEAYEWFKAKRNRERVCEPTPEDREFVEQVDYAQREIKEGFIGKIRLAVEQGFTGEGETNELLLTIAKLGRILYGLSGQAYIDYIRETVTSCPGYVRYCRHKHEIDRRCAEVARYGEKQWFPYRSRLPEERLTYQYIKNALSNQTNLNLERQHNARSRIIQAVEHIEEEQGGLPRKVGACKLAIRNVTKELFGISVSDATLKKPENLSLWHPKYREEGIPAPDFEHSSKVIEVFVDAQTQSEGDGSSCQERAESSQEELSTEELDKDLVVRRTVDEVQASQEQTILQQILPSESLPEEPQENQSTPLEVVRETEEVSTSLKPLPSGKQKKTVHTLAYMKGVVRDLVIDFIYQVFQWAYFNTLMETPRLELLYQGYRGYGATGLIHRKGQQQDKVQLILPNTEVEILREDYHSFCYRENPQQLLVYIKPLENAQDWLNGIAVLIDHLVPLRIRDRISESDKN